MSKSARELIAELAALDADEIYNDLQQLERQIEELEDEAKAMRVLLKAARTRKGQSDPGKKPSAPKSQLPKSALSATDRKKQIEVLLAKRGALPVPVVAEAIGYQQINRIRQHLTDRRFVLDESTDTVKLRNGSNGQSPT